MKVFNKVVFAVSVGLTMGFASPVMADDVSQERKDTCDQFRVATLEALRGRVHDNWLRSDIQDYLVNYGAKHDWSAEAQLKMIDYSAELTAISMTQLQSGEAMRVFFDVLESDCKKKGIVPVVNQMSFND